MSKLTMLECPFCDRKVWDHHPSKERILAVQCKSCHRTYLISWVSNPQNSKIFFLVGIQENPRFREALDSEDVRENMAKAQDLIKNGVMPDLPERHILGFEEVD